MFCFVFPLPFLRRVPDMFPNYIRAPNGAEAKPVSQLYKGQSSQNSLFTAQIFDSELKEKRTQSEVDLMESDVLADDEEDFLDITLSLMSNRSPNSSGNQEWWNIAIANCEPSSCDVLPMIIFNDKVSPPSLGFLAGYG